MKTMFKVKVCLLMLLCSVAAAMANPPVPVEKVKGTIKTPNGEPVIGATIIEKGTTNGTITDVNGNFVLKIMNKIGELEAACVGFKKVVFKPEKEIVSLIMEEDTKVLGEVVVTALGITREAKSLGYSVQKLGASARIQFCERVEQPYCRCADYEFFWWHRSFFEYSDTWSKLRGRIQL